MSTKTMSDYRISRSAWGLGFAILNDCGTELDYNGNEGWGMDSMRYETVREAKAAIERFFYGDPATMTATAEGDRAMAEAEADMRGGY